MGYKLKRILIYPDGVTEKQVYPAGWKPGANTIAYRPLKSDLKEASGKSGLDRSIVSGTVTYSNNMAEVTRLTTSAVLSGYSGDFTILAYTELCNSETGFFPICASNYYPNSKFGLMGGNAEFYYTMPGQWYGLDYSYSTAGVHLLVGVKTSSTMSIYIDGVLVNSISGSFGDTQSNDIALLGQDAVGSGTCKYGNIIVESKSRTATEISDYYNLTKSNYGL